MAVRTRFAPSPTGFLHVGSARTALFNWLLARSADGQFVLRIEDTDVARRVEGAEALIMDALRWLGIDWDEGPDAGGPYGPYVQSERLELYRERATELLESGHAYVCFCPSERLERLREEQAARKRPPRYDRHCRDIEPGEAAERMARGEPCVIRLRTPTSGQTVVHDFLRGELKFRNSTLDDVVLLKSDGYPTYHLASIVDDHEMRISHVMRAEEWIPSAPRHVLLYEAFGWEPPVFVHLPLILGADRSKLSKRSGDVDLLHYRRQGYLPEAMVNYLAFLGWTPRATSEILSREELVRLFALEQLSPSPSVFDIERLNWVNRQHLKRLPVEELAAKVAPYLQDAYGRATRHEGTALSAEAWLRSLVEAVRDELNRLSDIADSARFVFVDEFVIEEDAQQALSHPSASEVLRAFAESWAALPAHDYDHADALFKRLRKEFKESQGLSGKLVMQPIRAALTGSLRGPCLVVVSILLGRERCLQRVRAATPS